MNMSATVFAAFVVPAMMTTGCEDAEHPASDPQEKGTCLHTYRRYGGGRG